MLFFSFQKKDSRLHNQYPSQSIDPITDGDDPPFIPLSAYCHNYIIVNFNPNVKEFLGNFIYFF